MLLLQFIAIRAMYQIVQKYSWNWVFTHRKQGINGGHKG